MSSYQTLASLFEVVLRICCSVQFPILRISLTTSLPLFLCLSLSLSLSTSLFPALSSARIDASERMPSSSARLARPSESSAARCPRSRAHSLALLPFARRWPEYQVLLGRIVLGRDILVRFSTVYNYLEDAFAVVFAGSNYG